MKLLRTVAVVLVIVASIAVIFRYSDSLLAQFTSWNSTNAAVPGQVPFQAVLTQPDGVSVADGSYSIVFSLYTAASGGSPVWTEAQTVQTSGGVFSTELGSSNPITPSTVASEELWLGIKVGSDLEMSPRQRIGSAIYALVAQELANPKNPTILLSHDGFLQSVITCFEPPGTQFTVIGSGFQSGELVTVTAVGGAGDGSDADILTAVANSSGAFLAQGTSTSPAIPCAGGGPLTVVARGDKGSVSSQPVLVVTPTPTPTATPIPTPSGGTVSVAEDTVEWAAANGDDITSIQPDSTGIFLIRDDALETTKSGTAVFSGIPAGSKYFNIATGAAGPAAPGTTTGVTRVLTAPGYDTSTPSNTPLSGNPTASVSGSSTFVVGSDVNVGWFALLVAANATTTATFGYHVQDVWDGTDTTLRRAKVISDSDPAGEWVTISEVTSATDSSPNATSRLFRGEVSLLSNVATQGTNDDGVWVQAGDTVIVKYFDSAGMQIDSDTIGVPLP